MMRRLLPTLCAALAAAGLLTVSACGSAGDGAATAASNGGGSPTTTTGGGEPARSPDAVARAVVGQPEARATAQIEQAGYTWRVTARDGEEYLVTMDYIETRIGLEIKAGTVTAARVG